MEVFEGWDGGKENLAVERILTGRNAQRPERTETTSEGKRSEKFTVRLRRIQRGNLREPQNSLEYFAPPEMLIL